MRRRAARLGAAAVVSAAGLLVLAAASQVPYAHEAADGAELRLSWRARSAQVEACRRRSAEELARLPVHMRQELVCERGVAPYRLVVAIDADTVVDRVITAAGARRDRPLFVYETIPRAPGTYRLTVAFTRQTPAASGRAGTDDRRSAPAHLEFTRTITLSPGRAALVTYDENARRLHLVTPP